MTADAPAPPAPPPPPPPPESPHGFLAAFRVDVLDSVEGVEQVWVHLREPKGIPRIVKPTDAEFIYVALDAEGRPASVSFLRPKGYASNGGLPPDPPDSKEKPAPTP